MKLYLLRHGITQGNRDHLYYGATDLPLLPEGVDELQQRRQRFAYPTAGRYYTSPLQRTQQTLRELYGDVPFTVVEDLREMNFGEFEMRTEEELRRDPAFLAWDNEHIATNICPGGESFGGVQSRALAAIAPLLAVGEDAVCVIHGGVIACMMTHWFPGGGFARWIPHPGTGWCVTVEDGKPVSYIAIPEE